MQINFRNRHVRNSNFPRVLTFTRIDPVTSITSSKFTSPIVHISRVVNSFISPTSLSRTRSIKFVTKGAKYTPRSNLRNLSSRCRFSTSQNHIRTIPSQITIQLPMPLWRNLPPFLFRTRHPTKRVLISNSPTRVILRPIRFHFIMTAPMITNPLILFTRLPTRHLRIKRRKFSVPRPTRRATRRVRRLLIRRSILR